MKILVINSGSSSIKYQVFDMPGASVIAKGLVERIGEAQSVFTQKSIKGNYQTTCNIPDHETGINAIISLLTDKQHGIVDSASQISCVGHRVVHGGEEFADSVLITDSVIEKIEKYSDLAPLHNPPNIMGIKACKKLLAHATQVAVFDTAFHHTIPMHAYLYAIPYGFYETFAIRRYGFHGTSHNYVTKRLAQVANKDINSLNCITCHLGNGCSITAVKQGKSVDTSMGFTPLEGLVMGTRCGDIDPAIIFYLADKGYSVKEINNLLNKKSGLLGISSISNDMRNLFQARQNNDPRAKIAIDIFCYRIKKYLGSYLAVLGRTDAIVFTGGIGENNNIIRSESLSGLEYLGIEIDPERNNAMASGQDTKISKDSSRVAVYVIPTNEELQIALDAQNIASK